MRCFGRCRCDENIANNVRIAYCAVFNAVRVQDHFWEGPGLHFGSILATLGSLWHTLARTGGHMRTFSHIGAHLYFQVRFASNLGSQGDPKSEVGSKGGAGSGEMGKQHLAPLGRVPA